MTRLTDATQTPQRPRALLAQLPDCSCVIEDACLGAESCAAFTVAMGISRQTAHRLNPSGCKIRAETHDFSGGLVPSQCVARYEAHGVHAVPHTGGGVISPARMARLSRAGHGIHLMGNTGALIGTPQQSVANAVNHSVWLNEVRGGTLDAPAEALVYDPCADGRNRAYHVDQGPTWWPWSRVLAFCARLDPNADGRRLGPGKVYCIELPDTEPHVRLRAGAVRSTPFPDRTRADESTVRIRSGPSVNASIRYRVPAGTLLVGYQYAEGSLHEGSTRWLGNDDGTEWVHTKNLRSVGGTT